MKEGNGVQRVRDGPKTVPSAGAAHMGALGGNSEDAEPVRVRRLQGSPVLPWATLHTDLRRLRAR